MGEAWWGGRMIPNSNGGPRISPIWTLADAGEGTMTNLDRGFSRMGGSYTTPSNDADEFEFTTDGPGGRSPWLPVVAIGMLIVFIGGVWVAYQQGLKQGREGAPPLVTADRSPFKVEPEERGGLEPPADRRVYDVVEGAGTADGDVEALMTRNEAEDVIDAAAPAATAAASAPEPAVEGGDVVIPRPSERLVAGTSSGETAAQSAGISADIVRAKPGSIREDAPAQTASVEPAATAPAAPAGSRAQPDRNTPLETVNTVAGRPASAETPAAANPASPANSGNADSARVAARAPAAAPAAAEPAPASGGFVVQVGSYNSDQLAQNAWSTFSGRYAEVLNGQPHTVTRADLGSKGIWYRLGVGPYGSKSQADAICTELKSRKQDCLVRKL
jgi:cell division protein FtsN